ncbi:MAG: response regulator [Thermoguttaceae bacterium]|jgi:DNA-binding response OmpR family regulator
MRPLTFNLAMISQRLVWIVDAHPLDYGHSLADLKVRQLDIRFLASGRELLRYWQVRTPDVCLVNLRMPDFSGFDLVEMIQPFHEGTTVCLVADRYVLEDEVRALSLGVHSYLCKPLEAAVFFELCLCTRARREAASHAVASRWASLPPAYEANVPAKCKLLNAERRWLH